MRRRLTLASSLALLLACALVVLSCGSDNKTPVTPTPAGPVVSEVRLGMAGNAPTLVEPGKTAQLWAQAAMSDGTLHDVTNSANWQSSNLPVATVSPTGLVTSHGAGDTTITATMSSKTGSLQLQFRKECQFTLSPASLDVDAFGRTAMTVGVTSTMTSCGWTVKAGAGWLRVVGPANGTGTGSFTYDVTPNSTTDERAADLVISGEGATVRHHVSQGRPAWCSYVVTPSEVTVSLGGGSGTFRVNVTPDVCQWFVVAALNAYVYHPPYQTSPATGDRTLEWRAYGVDAPTTEVIKVCGLSGKNPCGLFTMHRR